MADRHTEIDRADDLLLSFDDEPGEEASAGTEMDSGESIPEEAAPSPLAEEAPEESELVAEKVKEEHGEDEGEADDEKKAPGRKRNLFVVYGVPLGGALVIFAFGWTFAFIARSGLAPPPAPKPEKTALRQTLNIPDPEKSTANLGKKVLPGPPKLELPEIKLSKLSKSSKPLTLTEKAGLPSKGKGTRKFSPPPGLITGPPVGKKEPLGFSVSLRLPFYIPLEGGKRRAGADNTTFLHLSLSLEMSNKAAASEVNAKASKIREAVFLHFNRLSPAELGSLKGIERTRQVLAARLSKEIVQGEVRRVLFREFFTR